MVTSQNKPLNITHTTIPSSDDLDLSIAHALYPHKTFAGNTKEARKENTRNGKNGLTFVKTYDLEYLLSLKYINIATCYKDYTNHVKVIVIDIDIKFAPTVQEAHDFISKNILVPTCTLSTDKGYQVSFGLSSAIYLSRKGRKLLQNITNFIIEKFQETKIKGLDLRASRRINGVFRNFFAHQTIKEGQIFKGFVSENILYNVDSFKKIIFSKSNAPVRNHAKKNIKRKKRLSAAKHSDPGTIKKSFNKMSKVDKIKKRAVQQNTLDIGHQDGNVNEYFYLMSNKKVYEAHQRNIIYNLNGVEAISTAVARSNENENPFDARRLEDAEISATAKKLFNYIQSGSLYLPTVFYKESSKHNDGLSSLQRQQKTRKIGFTEDNKLDYLKLVAQEKVRLLSECSFIKALEIVSTVYKKLSKKYKIYMHSKKISDLALWCYEAKSKDILYQQKIYQHNHKPINLNAYQKEITAILGENATTTQKQSQSAKITNSNKTKANLERVKKAVKTALSPQDTPLIHTLKKCSLLGALVKKDVKAKVSHDTKLHIKTVNKYFTIGMMSTDLKSKSAEASRIIYYCIIERFSTKIYKSAKVSLDASFKALKELILKHFFTWSITPQGDLTHHDIAHTVLSPYSANIAHSPP